MLRRTLFAAAILAVAAAVAVRLVLFVGAGGEDDLTREEYLALGEPERLVRVGIGLDLLDAVPGVHAVRFSVMWRPKWW